MTGFVIERNGFIDAASLIASLVADMVDNGFTLIHPTPFSANAAPFAVTLEASATVDPLHSTQPWRIAFDVQEKQTCFVYAGTPLTLPNDGSFTYDRKVISGVGASSYGPVDTIGATGTMMGSTSLPATNAPAHIDSNTLKWIPASVTSAAQTDDPRYGFINRRFRIGSGDGSNYPMTYRLSISDHGVWFGVWEDAGSDESGYNFNWVLIQRPVDRITGTVVTTGKAPVWCVNFTGANQDFTSNQRIWQFVVRESDILRPGLRRPADSDTADSDTIVNTSNQVSLSEDGKYVVTFPARLNTSRYSYSYELDMVGITSADVVSQDTTVPLTVYGESSPRTYKAMQSSNVNNTGMRVLVLTSGGGI